MHQLKALANQTSRASQFTRTLKIQSLAPCRDLSLLEQCIRFIAWEPSADAVEAGLREHLVAAISSLKNIESVM
jgi:hypothetical protein